MKNIKICIVGLGYVGLPLAVEFAKYFDVVGLDIDIDKVKKIQDNFDPAKEVSSTVLENSSLKVTSSFDNVTDANVYIITVPTPVDGNNIPDLTPILSATKSISKILSDDDVVIYESTVYPGTTEELCVPLIEKVSGLKFNKSFYVGYSPERINPGDKTNTLTQIVKITSGSTPNTADFVDRIYSRIIKAGTFKASTIKVAEAAKVIENTQRDVNIAVMNEFAMIFDRLDICVHDVVEAASTKWNFIKMTPGLVGGHCISVDPYYLIHKSIEKGFIPDILQASRKVNEEMPVFVARKIIDNLIFNKVDVSSANILVLGTTFKENCPDIRNSKVFTVVDMLRNYVENVDIYDPVASEFELARCNYEIITNQEIRNDYDAILLLVGHNLIIDDIDLIFEKQLDCSFFFDLKGKLKINSSDIKYLTL